MRRFTRRQTGSAKMVKYATALFLFFEVFSGPIRYYSTLHGAAWSIYIPKVALVIVMLGLLGLRQVRSPIFFLVIAVITIYICVGLGTLPDPDQPFFSLWTMVPLLFSLATTEFLQNDLVFYRRIFYGLFATVVCGVTLNYFHNVPWAGSNSFVHGFTVQTSRAWTTQGFIRIAGFGRSSFSTASEALVLAIFLINYPARPALKITIWCIAGVTIFVTTSKGVGLAYIVLTMYYLSNGAAQRVGRSFPRFVTFLIGATVTIFVVFMIFIPLLTINENLQINTDSSLSQLLFSSFSTRLSASWPQAFSLLNGSMLAYLFGNGIGGLGVSQQYFDPLNYNAGDNLFVFLTIQYGMVVSLLFIGFLFWKFIKSVQLPDRSPNALIFISLSVFILVYGCLINELEEGFLSFSIGYCLAFKQPLSRRNSTKVAASARNAVNANAMRQSVNAS